VQKLFAFLKKDFVIHFSYRLNWITQIASTVFYVCAFFYLSKFIGVASLGVPGGDYFSFVIIGFALQDFSSVSLRTFSQYVRESQLAGNLEVLLSTQTPLYAVIILSAMYPMLWTSLNVGFYFFIGWWLFGLSLSAANWMGATVILALTVIVLSAIGIISASFVLVFKRGDPVGWLIESLTWLLGGVLFPVSVLPPTLKSISAFLPIRYAIDGMRESLLQHASWSQLWPSIWPLMVFAVVVLPISLGSFYFANRWVRTVGSLSEY